MTLGQFFLLYLLAGGAVAAAVYLTFPARGPAERAVQTATALLFWPFYFALLLSRDETGTVATSPEQTVLPPDALERAIAQVDAELDRALHGLGGWADGVLWREHGHLHELRAAWAAQAASVREMDRLLGQLEWAADEPLQRSASERVVASRQAVRENIHRLRQVRAQTHQDLMEALAWVRELVSMIHLAKFSAAPAARAEELIAQLAGAVHGLAGARPGLR